MPVSSVKFTKLQSYSKILKLFNWLSYSIYFLALVSCYFFLCSQTFYRSVKCTEKVQSKFSHSENPCSLFPDHESECYQNCRSLCVPSRHHAHPIKSETLGRVWLFPTPWTVAYQDPPSMGFSKQEYWSGLPFPSPGNIPDPGIEPRSPAL